MRIYQDEIEDAMSDFEIKSCGHTQPIKFMIYRSFNTLGMMP
jgi:hypothetical protein